MSHIRVCRKCLETKSSDEYYESNLATCKVCVRAKSKQQREINISTPEGLDKERERHRNKYHRLGYKDIHKPTPEKKAKIIKAYNEKYPEKYKAKLATQRIEKINKENQLHHWSYNEEHYNDCFELSVSDHASLHRFLVYDEKSFYYRDLEGNLLDTKEKHENYIKQQNIEIYTLC